MAFGEYRNDTMPPKNIDDNATIQIHIHRHPILCPK